MSEDDYDDYYNSGSHGDDDADEDDGDCDDSTSTADVIELTSGSRCLCACLVSLHQYALSQMQRESWRSPLHARFASRPS